MNQFASRNPELFEEGTTYLDHHSDLADMRDEPLPPYVTRCPFCGCPTDDGHCPECGACDPGAAS
jgi:hypothetical protein